MHSGILSLLRLRFRCVCMDRIQWCDLIAFAQMDHYCMYRHTPDHPERAALYFVCGVCLGLVLTLIALVVQISCRTDCKRQKQAPRKTGKTAESTSDTSDSDSDWDNTSDLSARRHRRFERTLGNVFTSAEELERAQRLEERERIIREIWMNGQPDMPGTRSLNRYY
ncbi:protein eva-1 homolog A isoform X1 [Megalobrama amblycephala]|uniref:protein eva-1 homolog A isoform X1 n=1 Tax=Megalobrama amblycephala TaxID=75352 RepID=UPI002013FF49|nr:protein eva-1 homolog A isoform X1 [Megalobrama amblycephala]